eukprot:3350581-Prorocentrum_lima.AAC.1
MARAWWLYAAARRWHFAFVPGGLWYSTTRPGRPACRLCSEETAPSACANGSTMSADAASPSLLPKATR